MSVFVATPQRRQAAQRARRTVLIIAIVLFVGAIAALIAFPPGTGTRLTLTGASLVLAVLAVLMMLRIGRVAAKADLAVAADGEMLRVEAGGIRVRGDVLIPWQNVSGVWASDRGVELRRRAATALLGAPGRVMLRAGVNTADVTIGIVDTAAVAGSLRLLKRFSPVEGGLTPGRIELPFGAWFDSDDLARLLHEVRAALPAEVPVRLTEGVMDYAAAWAGTADSVATIRTRESSRPRP